MLNILKIFWCFYALPVIDVYCLSKSFLATVFSILFEDPQIEKDCIFLQNFHFNISILNMQLFSTKNY